jgi:Negative regulator of sigma F
MSEFELDSIGDVPDPLSGIDGERPLPSLRVAASPSSTRAQVSRVRAVALGAALLYEFAWLAVMNKRGDLHTLGPATLVVEVGIPVVAAVLALAAATDPGALGLGPPKGRLAALSLLAPALFMAATLVVAAVVPVGEDDTGSFWGHCLGCFAWTSLYSAGPLVVAGWAFRRSFVAAPAWRTAALAMACAASGAATMSVVCSVGSPAHVLIGHGGLMFVAALVGAGLGRRFGQV